LKAAVERALRDRVSATQSDSGRVAAGRSLCLPSANATGTNRTLYRAVCGGYFSYTDCYMNDSHCRVSPDGVEYAILSGM
jgi:hypothetical protein